MTHNRRLAISFSLALASAFVFSTGSAGAACSQWDMPARMMIQQTNETLIGLEVSPVEGQVDGSTVQFTIHWGRDIFRHVPNATGIYTGTIGPQGRMTGFTYDALNPDTKANWYGTEVLTCHVAAAPAPRQAPSIALGRVKPANGSEPAPLPAICEAARSARARNSPAASSLERQCAAAAPK
ncbi:hypothetical protein [Sphingomonas sp. Root241]|uniref:hypothetical protein n=1 Tax=Sphingomonas sp. Root241 TaxID=1736501 RepID=UPI0012E3BBE4|nr:hypothetical protein [Sphingomonas sp. Root241]